MDFDIIVIGGGHAGIEAANIAAKKRLRVLLITNHLDLIGQMSCNPSIGGIAKGNIVREIDALGGLMGKLIDKAGIHFKMLNKSKGMAVWGNRAQADKVRYRNLARKELEKSENVSFLQGMVKEIVLAGELVGGVVMDSGETIKAQCVILATGTFLEGLIHIGLSSFPSGRAGEPPSESLAKSITAFGIESGRLKTGTSPRIDGRTVDFAKLESQPGDTDPWPFSFSTEEPIHNTVVCWIGKSNAITHTIIKDNLNRSPLYTGKIKSIGPRYCPSIEDKVVRFEERDAHTLFLEPESVENKEMYLNGLATSLPYDVQYRMVHSINGLENARILRPGYGIEYTYFQPKQLFRTLESKKIQNLYFAGQINGTSGYEEAACQGIIAGINATQRIRGEEEFIANRDSSYIGVLIDDLVSKGTEEPYRMFTSRAEYRLLLRQDNCDERLMPVAHRLGFIATSLYEKRQRIWGKKADIIEKLKITKINSAKWEELYEETLEHTCKAFDLLKRPFVTLERLKKACAIEIPDNCEIRMAIEADIKYSGFISKQKGEIEKMRRLNEMVIPDTFDYNSVFGLLTESRLKLSKNKPSTLGQAAGVQGVTPADISILAIILSRKSIS